MKFVNFRNMDQVALYECELKGQISDGMWENSLPTNHWTEPCSARAVANPCKPLGPNFHPRQRYDFDDPDLLSVVSSRMIFWVKALRVFPNLPMDSYWEWHVEKQSLLMLLNPSTKYWEEKKAGMEKLFGMDILKALSLIDAVNYKEKDLVLDLRDMKNIFAIRQDEDRD